MGTLLGPRAVYRPQGTCPRPWVAQINGVSLFDGRGGLRRFATEESALKAARAAGRASTPTQDERSAHTPGPASDDRRRAREQGEAE